MIDPRISLAAQAPNLESTFAQFQNTLNSVQNRKASQQQIDQNAKLFPVQLQGAQQKVDQNAQLFPTQLASAQNQNTLQGQAIAGNEKTLDDSRRMDYLKSVTAFDPVLRPLLENGDQLGALSALQQRKQQLVAQNRPTETTDDAIKQLMDGNVDVVLGGLDMAKAEYEQALNLSGIGGRTEKTPAAVQETEWFQNQTPEVQEAHLKVKRGETLSQKEQLSLDKAKSEIKIRESMILDATKMSKEAIGQIDGLRSSISTIDSAIAEIDKGATVGKIESFLPNFKASTIALQNLGNKMGLDIVSATTFGALSEGELRLAMSTAMPQFNNSKDLKNWLVDKKKSQKKLMGELRKMAIKLGSGKMTPAEYLEQNGYSEAVSWSDL